MSKKLSCKFIIYMCSTFLITFINPSESNAVTYPSANIAWLCDLSDSANNESLHNAYNLFAGLFDDIADRDSNVIIIRDDFEAVPVHPWSDKSPTGIGGRANVVQAFHRAVKTLSPLLESSDEQIQLVVFSNMCQTVSINEAREQIGEINHADSVSIESAQRLLNEDLSELEFYHKNDQLDIHIVKWNCENCDGLSLPDWVEVHSLDLQKDDFENRFCEIIGELYAKLLTGSAVEWKDSDEIYPENTHRLIMLDSAAPLSFENAHNGDWGKLRVIDTHGDTITLDKKTKFIAIPILEWEVQVSAGSGNTTITRNSGLYHNNKTLEFHKIM